MPEASSGRVQVPGSDRAPLPGARPTTSVDANATLTVTVLLRRRRGAAVPDVDRGAGPAPEARITRAAFTAQMGADPGDVNLIQGFAKQYGLQVGQIDLASRTVALTGTVSALSEAFEVQLRQYEHPGGSYRGREGRLTIPRELEGIVQGVFGLDDRPQAQPKIRWQPSAPAGAVSVLDVSGSFTVTEVARLYGFPTDVTGKGQCIGIVEFGGGYRDQDLQQFFQGLKLAGPRVSSISVDGAQNAPGDPADMEVALDIEVAGAIAPDAAIAVYFAPNTDQGFINAFAAAVHDTANAPSIISISWGGPEETWTGQTRAAIDGIFTDAAVLGISVLAAAGDHGSADRAPADAGYDGVAHVDFPASSPHATACGGTHLEGSADQITAESVWNDGDGWATGGGISAEFPTPAWQAAAKLPRSVNKANPQSGRGVPDVSGNADITSGYKIFVNGAPSTAGGTSAVAPLWAGLIALINQSVGRKVGFINPVLYAPAASGSLRSVTTGSNEITSIGGQPATAGYQAGPGWNACTGLGTPNGKQLRDLFAKPTAP